MVISTIVTPNGIVRIHDDYMTTDPAEIARLLDEIADIYDQAELEQAIKKRLAE